MNEIRVVGIDLGKNVFHLICMDGDGQIVKRRRCSRPQLFAFFRNRPSCLVGMEACASAHFIGRTLAEVGHEARLMPAQYVKPYVGQQKNDFADAEAIAEAVQRPRMRFVPIKTREQLELQAVHRVRDRLVARRTAVSNQIRGLLVEHGIVMRKGRGGFRGFVPALLSDEAGPLPPAMRQLVGGLWEEWCATDAAVQDLSRQLEHLAKKDEACRRLMTVPGVGALVATAMVAAVADGSAFARGRDFAAWLGLVPQQMSTGGKTRLGSITKRGNTYLRRMFIHGARSFRLNGNREAHRIGAWLDDLDRRMHKNVATVALANKLARIAWSVLRGGEEYRGRVGAA
ncbi:MAG: IS110 family transposase [Pseudomonadota bacterium]